MQLVRVSDRTYRPRLVTLLSSIYMPLIFSISLSKLSNTSNSLSSQSYSSIVNSQIEIISKHYNGTIVGKPITQNGLGLMSMSFSLCPLQSY